MRPEFDGEIDSVLRGHARRGGALPAWGAGARPSLSDGAAQSAHLDADEIAAFGEGALPLAARARYSAHLADCDDCRRNVTQVVTAAGVAERVQEPERGVAVAAAASYAAKQSPAWRERLAAVFAPRAWRYAMPVIALVAVSAVVLVVTRRLPREGALEMAANRGRIERPASAPAGVAPEAHHAEGPQRQDAQTRTQAGNTAATDLAAAGGVGGAGAGVEAAKTQPKSVDENAASSSVGASGGSAGAQPEAAQPQSVRDEPPPPVSQSYTVAATPSPLPPAPGAAPAFTREITAATPAPAPARAEAESRERSREEERAAAAPRDEVAPTKRHGPQRSLGGSTSLSTAADAAKDDRTAARRARGPVKAESKRGDDSDAKARREEDGEQQQSETRAVGGRRFRREGNVWIDTAYRAGQATVVVRAGSEQYRALVADEPEIGRISRALGGEAVIVWKGRAYRVKP